ncbi:uncharacterized protein FSUBG_6733 [Fusarium subglutinans]|uniref:Uncharacterized protein n=1 Tax=Gibberella subglutinans TaxID=42677 RepID=A0A8H5PX46_GIBSU|nr:uncharacterized protein FSUBG_6733 [Fusarium subglutinans]KAF5604755.1 hypothetical protein FSUBG_6733 [Fusarium subglutinans]
MGQRTFTVIPKFPGRADYPDKPPLRPMTSKQVRNAYKAANKGPKLTREESRRQERAEQERIRKEFEREKAAAKAKVARDKKKEKELAEKEAKRKKGLPLVNVRPSQETISWFVRGNGTSKKRDAQGNDIKDDNAMANESNADTNEAMTSEEQPQQPATKAQKLDDIQEDDEEISDAAMETIVEDLPKPLRESPKPQSPEGKNETNAEQTEQREALVASETAPENPPMPEIELEGLEDELDADFEEDLALGILEDIEAAMGNPKSNMNHGVQKTCNKTHEEAPATKQPLEAPRNGIPNRYAEDLGLKRPAPPFSFAKPPLPQHNLEPRSSSPPHQEPPMSTQAILFNLDDFFPSSSQQVRELEEELDEGVLPSAPLHLTPIAEEDEESFDEGLEKSSDQTPLPPLEPASDSPPTPPRRFFTSSGSHERMCLAIQRSRRTAALEKIQQRERARMQAGMIEQAQAESRRMCKPREPTRKPSVFSNPPPHAAQCNQPRKPPFKTPPTLQKTRHSSTTTSTKRAEPQLSKQPPKKPSPRLSNNPNIMNPRIPPKRIETPKQHLPPLPQKSKENQKPPQQPFALSASQESYGGEWVDDLDLDLMI